MSVRGDQAEVEQQCLLDGDLVAALVDQVEPLAGAVEHGAEVGADGAHEPLGLSDRLAEERLASLLPLGGGRELVRGDRLDRERGQHER